jgi:hypothetical protein
MEEGRMEKVEREAPPRGEREGQKDNRTTGPGLKRRKKKGEREYLKS